MPPGEFESTGIRMSNREAKGEKGGAKKKRPAPPAAAKKAPEKKKAGMPKKAAVARAGAKKAAGKGAAAGGGRAKAAAGSNEEKPVVEVEASAAPDAAVKEDVSAGGEGGAKVRRKRSDNQDGWYPETRKTLIERLDNWEDRASWDEFYRTYANFVFRVAMKAGLTESEANDALQETFIGIAKNLQKKRFDTGIGSFKAWLMNQARWRIIDQFRNRKKDLSAQNPGAPGEKTRRTATLDRYADPKGEPLEKIWETEWRESLLDIALRVVKGKVSAQQYQIFTCYVIKGWSAEKVKDELGVNVAQVYLAKHRVGRILKKELAKLGDKAI